ncbi:hypothetical protein M426DRAFT_20897 [Hypoxylon sp. CI-4A]|nr:hypothetical protein M426DRAFT_20897 [Hypoxylon sp. CI-4A]
MSYQYPPPQEAPGMGASQVGYTGASHLAATASTSEMSPLRQRDSLSKKLQLKRSVSTPNVRPQGSNKADHGSLGRPNEKKRNKLGYHRTPIACEHCRNRKIRCKQLEPADAFGRCESCLHLNKECTYVAVNQPLPPTVGKRQGTRSSTRASLASPSISPAIPTAPKMEPQSSPPYHQLTTMSSISSIGQQSMDAEDEACSAEPKIEPNVPSDRSFSYGHGTNDWMPTETGAGATKAPSSTNPLWTNFSHGLSETSEISPYAAQQIPTWPANAINMSRIDSSHADAWRQYPSGSRSISFSEEHTGHFTSPSIGHYDNRAQPPTATNFAPQPSLGAQGSLSAGAVSHPTYSAWPQYQYARPNEDYSSWYDDRESSEHIPSAAEDPSQAGGMYYGGR